jgi:very-short-patch-repair endonuclease
MTPTRRRVKGIRTRRCRNIHPLDASTFRGIPVTTVPRILVNLAPDLPLNQLSRAFHEAGVRHGIKPKHVEAVLDRRPTSPGAGKLRRVMHGDVPVTLSKLESAFLTQLRNTDLPLPQTNKPAGGRYVDCHWPEHKLTVELDSYRYHNSRHAWEQDRRREREARARDDEFRRYTYGDVFEEPRLMLAELRAVLVASRPAAGLGRRPLRSPA